MPIYTLCLSQAILSWTNEGQLQEGIIAGKWEHETPAGTTLPPGIYVQEDRYGKPRYKAAYRALSNGKSVVTSQTFSTVKQAKDFLADVRIKRRTNTLPDVSKGARTVTELWDHFEKTKESSEGGKIKESTFATYEHRWRNHIQPALGHRRLDSLTRPGIREFLADLEARKGLDTRRKVQQVLHRMLALAVDDEWLTKNPADRIKMPKARPKREPRALTDDEVKKLASEMPPRYRALVWMLADTGARPGEITALKVKNLDGSVRIEESTVEVGGKKITGTPKTAKSIRNVPISPRLRAAIRDHYDAGFANRFDPESFVFTSAQGTQISQSNLRNRVLRPGAERIGIDDFTTYDLRHTAISLWLMKGVKPWTVAEMVGHTDLKMIKERYGHLYESAAQEEIDRVGAADVS